MVLIQFLIDTMTRSAEYGIIKIQLFLFKILRPLREA